VARREKGTKMLFFFSTSFILIESVSTGSCDQSRRCVRRKSD